MSSPKWLIGLCTLFLIGAALVGAPRGLTATPAPTPTLAAFNAQIGTPGTPALSPTRPPWPTPTPLWVPQPALACLRCPPVPVFHTNATGEWTLARLPQPEEGTEPLSLTAGIGRALAPAYAPNGRWLAFQANEDGNWELYTLDLDSRARRRLTNDPARDTQPLWQPACLTDTVPLTGTLVFQSDRHGKADLFLLTLDPAATPRPVTTAAGNNTDPAWAPDGSLLAFQSDRAGNWDIFTIRPEGSDEQQRTHSPADETDPAWSPRGNALAYLSNRNGDHDLYLLDLNSGRERPLTTGTGDDLLPAWSPDGRWLAFQSNRDGNWELYAYDVISNTLLRLTTNPAADEAPTWNCDGSRVLFQSNRDGEADLYSVALHNPTDFAQLTFQPSAEVYPLWQPPFEAGSLVLEQLPPAQLRSTPTPELPPATPTALPGGSPAPTTTPIPSRTPAPAAAPTGRPWIALFVIGGLLLLGWGLFHRRERHGG